MAEPVEPTSEPRRRFSAAIRTGRKLIASRLGYAVLCYLGIVAVAASALLSHGGAIVDQTASSSTTLASLPPSASAEAIEPEAPASPTSTPAPVNTPTPEPTASVAPTDVP